MFSYKFSKFLRTLSFRTPPVTASVQTRWNSQRNWKLPKVNGNADQKRILRTLSNIWDVAFYKNSSRLKTVRYSRNKLLLRCFNGLWIRLCRVFLENISIHTKINSMKHTSSGVHFFLKLRFLNLILITLISPNFFSLK